MRWRSSGVEQLFCKQPVGGSNPSASFAYIVGLRISCVTAIGLWGVTRVAKWDRL